MDYFADDTKGNGNLYELIANYLQDTCRKKHQSAELLVFYYPSG